MSGAFPARWRGVCFDCGEPFDAGDDITYNAIGWLIHDVCPDAPNFHTTEVACTTCWLIHPEGACDR